MKGMSEGRKEKGHVKRGESPTSFATTEESGNFGLGENQVRIRSELKVVREGHIYLSYGKTFML